MIVEDEALAHMRKMLLCTRKAVQRNFHTTHEKALLVPPPYRVNIRCHPQIVGFCHGPKTQGIPLCSPTAFRGWPMLFE